MITYLIAYIKIIVALTIFSTMANMLMPDDNFKKYTELVLGFLILATVITPLFNLFGFTEESIKANVSEIHIDYYDYVTSNEFK